MDAPCATHSNHNSRQLSHCKIYMESASLPVDALDEPLLLRHQESEDSLLDLGEERDGLLEIGRILLELLLQQVPEGLVHDLLHLRFERGGLLLRLQILNKLIPLDKCNVFGTLHYTFKSRCDDLPAA